MSLVAYMRQSRSSERSISIAEQREVIERWALAHGESVVFEDRYIERNVSGAKRWQERELGAVIEALRAGAASGIIVAYQDRLARPTWLQEAEVWEALSEADSRLVCAAEGADFRPGDLEHSDARLLYRIKTATARHTWERHCRNWRKGKHSAWLRGVYVGPTPAGYERDAEGRLVQNGLAPVIREAFELKGRGGSAGEVAKLLTASGVRTYRGRSVWTRATAQSLLCNEVYTGLHPCTCNCGESVHRPQWEIVPRWLWRKAQPGRAELPYSRGEGYVLGEGLCRCGHCGGGLVRSGTAKGRYRQLRCKAVGRGHAAISYAKAEQHIVSAAIEHLGLRMSELHVGDDADEVEAAQAARASACEELAEVEALRGSISPASYAQAHSDALAAVESAEDALAALDRGEEWWRQPYLLTIAGGNRLAFDALSVPEQRRLLHEQIARVTLRPGRGAAEERLEIEWKQKPGPREITDKDWTVLQFSDWAGLAFQGVPADAPITSEILETLREQAVAELRSGGGLRTPTPAARRETAGEVAADKAKA
jgi:DNA invertase Pin-like site-specific DNA recombinase